MYIIKTKSRKLQENLKQTCIFTLYKLYYTQWWTDQVSWLAISEGPSPKPQAQRSLRGTLSHETFIWFSSIKVLDILILYDDDFKIHKLFFLCGLSTFYYMFFEINYVLDLIFLMIFYAF